MNNEIKKLDTYKFSTKTGFNSILLGLRYKFLSKYFKGKTCLELGSADGEGTKMLLKHFDSIVAVDGSPKLVKKAKKGIKNRKVSFVISLFKDLALDEKFDTVILAHILEHVDNPVDTIKVAAKFVNDGGVLIIDVPNARSIHRQVGVLMGMLKSEYELNSADLSIGHKRVYDMNLLMRDIEKAGLSIKEKGGLFLKSFSNKQLERMLNKKGVEAFNLVGMRYPDIAAEIFVIAINKK